MPANDQAEVVAYKPPKKRYIVASLLPLLPLGLDIGGVPILLLENSKFLEAGGWWDSLSGKQQLASGALAYAMWVVAVAGVALVHSLVSRRWRKHLWVPIWTRMRELVRRVGLRIAGDSAVRRRAIALDKASEQKAAVVGPPRARRSGLDWDYGDLLVSQNMRDGSRSVRWKANGLTIGLLVPSGQGWVVSFGHRTTGVRPEFVEDEFLGEALTDYEAVDLLRQYAQPTQSGPE